MRYGLSFAGLAAAFLLTACATGEPIVVSSQFTRPDGASWSATDPHVDKAKACKVHVADVVDLRSDKQSMGDVGLRQIRAADTAVWVRAALESLGQDADIKLVGAGEGSDVELNVQLLKAYVLRVTQEKAAHVVVHVRYSRAGTLIDEKNFRGSDTTLLWASDAGETQEALNRALIKLTDAVHDDVLAHCKQVKAQGAAVSATGSH
jgi:hypothetical protein